MPTLPRNQADPAPIATHQHRQVAESFGVDAERYDRTRPGYPDPLVARIVAASPGPEVLDVGCGTGIAARQFRAAGCTVLGVDPDERMAAFARRDGLAVEVATFEAWDAAGRTFDAVVAGQAWHWVDPVAGATKAATVLRPGGLLAPFWHVFELPPDVAQAFGAALRRVASDSAPTAYLQAGTRAADTYQAMVDTTANGIRQAGGFSEPEEWRFDWERTYPRDELLDQLPTSGVLTRMPKPLVAEVLSDVGSAIDAMGGSVTIEYTTVAVAAVRTDAS